MLVAVVLERKEGCRMCKTREVEVMPQINKGLVDTAPEGVLGKNELSSQMSVESRTPTIEAHAVCEYRSEDGHPFRSNKASDATTHLVRHPSALNDIWNSFFKEVDVYNFGTHQCTADLWASWRAVSTRRWVDVIQCSISLWTRTCDTLRKIPLRRVKQF